MSCAQIESDTLVTFAYRRWEELRDDIPPPTGVWPANITGQRAWELMMHLYSAVEAKVEKIRWFAQQNSPSPGNPAPVWLEGWRSNSPLLKPDETGRADKLLSDRPAWEKLRPCILDVQDLRHGMAHPNPTVFTALPHQSGRIVNGMVVIDDTITESRSKRIDRDSQTYPHTGLPFTPLHFDSSDAALGAGILVAVLAETNSAFDSVYFTHTNGRAWGRGVQPDEWLKELTTHMTGPEPITAFLEALAT